MTITKTIKLTENERKIVQDFLKLTDDIADETGSCMVDVMEYFVENAIFENGNYHIDALHQIDAIG